MIRFLFLILGIAVLAGQKNSRSLNDVLKDDDSLIRRTGPVIPGDIPDPTVIDLNGTYYASGTSSEWAPYFPLFRSADLIHWKQAGYILRKRPSWAVSSFWAPELFFHRNKVYAYYVARRKSDNVSCIGVAVAANIRSTFHDQGVLLEFGKEAIDPFIFNDGGKLYLTFKAYGLDHRPIEILGCRLSDDGLKVAGPPFSLMRDDHHILMEGQCIVKNKGRYYMIYSSGGCCGIKCTYQVRVARANSFKGPYHDMGEPLLADEEQWKCPGHGTVVGSREGRTFYLYHAYNKTDDIYTGRQGMLKEMFWDKTTGWPFFKNVHDGTIPDPRQGLADHFDSERLPDHWQWDNKYDRPVAELRGSRLYLNGSSDSSNKVGTSVTVRPYSGNYTVSVGIIGRASYLQGLVVYGDDQNAVGIGTRGDLVQAWEIRNGVRRSLSERPVLSERCEVKISVLNGNRYRFSCRAPGGDWLELRPDGNDHLDGSYLPRWDRAPRPGLITNARATERAAFASFRLNYLPERSGQAGK